MPRNTTQNEQMRAESREKILATTRQLFAERGYAGCNVSDIARQAGMSQEGNSYWYFSSKEELLKAVLTDGFETRGTLMAETAAQSGSTIDKLDYLLERYLTVAQELHQRLVECGVPTVSLTYPCLGYRPQPRPPSTKWNVSWLW